MEAYWNKKMADGNPVWQTEMPKKSVLYGGCKTEKKG